MTEKKRPQSITLTADMAQAIDRYCHSAGDATGVAPRPVDVANQAIEIGLKALVGKLTGR